MLFSETAISEAIAVAACLVLAWLSPRIGWGWWRQWEARFSRLANRRLLTALLVGLLPIAIRVATLSIYPVPQPRVHDEFGHLLIADTLAHGRLANPPHPMWVHFESIYILHQPSYASYYPPTQGISLALAQMLGLPHYASVVFFVGLACFTLTWMLQGWIPPRWALLGGVLAVFRFSIFSQWVGSYWGGALPAIGGALVLGALPRMIRRHRPLDAALMGLGFFVLAGTRPWEAFLLSVPLGVGVLLWLFRSRQPGWDVKLSRVVLPLALSASAGAGFLAYYNYRVTGDPLELPYQLHRQLYGTPQTFYFLPPVPPGQFRYREVRDMYVWQLEQHAGGASPAGLLKATLLKLNLFWHFYLGPALTVPLLLLPWFWRNAKLRFPLIAGALVSVGTACYPFFFPHYAAPLAGVVLLAVVAGFRRLRFVTLNGQPFGVAAVRMVAAVLIGGVALQLGADVLEGGTRIKQPNTPRTQVIQLLAEKWGGQHLVFVRYSPDHTFHDEIVYNAADIDNARVVWARDYGDEMNHRLMRYYPNRVAWVFQPDAKPPKLDPYKAEGTAQPGAGQPGAAQGSNSK